MPQHVKIPNKHKENVSLKGWVDAGVVPTTRVPQGVGRCKGGNRNWLGWEIPLLGNQIKFECVSSFD